MCLRYLGKVRNPNLSQNYKCNNLKTCYRPRVGSEAYRPTPRLLAGCRNRRLNQAPLNLRGLIWLLMMVWSKSGNINTAALVTIVQCNTRCVMFWVAYGYSRLGFCHTGTLTLCLGQRRLLTVHIVTRWSGSSGNKAYLIGQLASFGALMLLIGSSEL